MKKLILFLLLTLPCSIFAQTTNDDADGRRDDRMARELNLSKDQELRWLNAKRDYQAKVAAVKADESLTKDQQKRKLKQLRDERHQAQQAILTPDQAKRYDSLKKEQKAAKKARKSDKATEKRVKAAKKGAKGEKKKAEEEQE